jgi:hypothetical protein
MVAFPSSLMAAASVVVRRAARDQPFGSVNSRSEAIDERVT